MDPTTADGLLRQATVAAQQNRWQDALGLIEQVISAHPNHPPALGLRGSALLRLGRAAEAVEAFRRFTQVIPGEPHGHTMLVQALTAAGQFEAAETACVSALTQFPAHLGLHTARGRIHLARNDKPRAAAAWADGARYVAPAGPLSPPAADLMNAYGCCLVELGRAADAVPILTRVSQSMPAHRPFAYNLALAQRQSSLLEQAAGTLERLLVTQEEPHLLRELAAVRGEQARLDETLRLQRRLLALKPDDASLRSDYLLTLQYAVPEGSPVRAEEHRRLAEGPFATSGGRNLPAHAGHLPAEAGRPLGKIRVAYLSADFCTHPVASFVLGLLAAHDRSAFEVHAYHVGRKSDATTALLKKATDQWHEVPRNVTDAQLAEQIRGDRIDVLVDLSGHTGGNRLPVLALRPARVQLHYLGYPGTTGLTCFDGFITDAVCDPPGTGEVFTEPLMRMERCWCAWTPPTITPEVTPLPWERNGFVTFGSLHAPKKITDRTLSLWAEVLRAVPTARLRVARVGLVASAADALRGRMSSAGLDLSRVDLVGTLPAGSPGTGPAAHLALFGEVDVHLDVTPFTGHTTSVEAAYMGVPTLTLAGSEHRSRMVASVNVALGLNDWVANSPEPYVARATEAAADRTGLATLRSSLRARLMASPLGDSAGLARAIEGAIRAVVMGQ